MDTFVSEQHPWSLLKLPSNAPFQLKTDNEVGHYKENFTLRIPYIMTERRRRTLELAMAQETSIQAS
ncbi:hypothetical protein N7520_001066 [Penicillium odoratum]|uniref:uncharacterized protein n=1 Tax=Penicillium odoratum TaxID=1167516 RepID=UPI0025496D00|nr:uncharacterized protein N7520_001066 [Penicillium odoratum]KAJ5777820.1 hypothetical protein N7520_001066 [Penicillium odoratum]